MTHHASVPRQAEQLMLEAARVYLRTLEKDCNKAQIIVDAHARAFDTVMANSTRFNELIHKYDADELLKDPIFSELQALQKNDKVARRTLTKGVTSIEPKLFALKMECQTLGSHINLLEQRLK
jgi:hypothetical protein